jgi:large subunit ribosomal protein L9
MSKKIKAILRQSIKNAGNAGDVIEIKRGYFNYLKKEAKVDYATKSNMAALEENRIHLESEDQEKKKQAQNFVSVMKNMTLVFDEEGSDTGLLYGSVTTRRIRSALLEKKIAVLSSQIHMSAPLKECGEHDISVEPYPGVQAQIKVTVRLKNTSTLTSAVS